MTLTRMTFKLWLHKHRFQNLEPVNGYEVYQSGLLIVGIDWKEKECVIFTYEQAKEGKIIPLQKIQRFTDAFSLVCMIEIYLDRRYV